MEKPILQIKTHQREDGQWVILDQPETPFWYAAFNSEEDAVKAWIAWEDLILADRFE